MKQYTEHEAAQLVASFYQIIDGDRDADDYLLRSGAILRVCLDAFQDYTYQENNRIISLFLICHQQEINTVVLDEIGADEASRLTQEAFNKTDANLRAIVSVLTGQRIALPHPPEIDFVNQFNAQGGNVVYMVPRKEK